ncbi:hypothetical protein Acr_06g0004680 [Actinidia rufa]|uniref:Uncharacterized protein n=1 Tax=Actinidia rufa TaxID=165716 RepID=A0A7J0EPX5_9ERIC|nr:hypothetical protein Acr_06g0004680 [Actinidia rufa]
MSLLGPIVDDTNLLDDQRQELEGRISQLNEDIAEHNESRERELPLVQDVEAKVKELHQTIAGLNNHQVSLKASIRKMKDKAKEMDEKEPPSRLPLLSEKRDSAFLARKRDGNAILKRKNRAPKEDGSLPEQIGHKSTTPKPNRTKSSLVGVKSRQIENQSELRRAVEDRRSRSVKERSCDEKIPRVSTDMTNRRLKRPDHAMHYRSQHVEISSAQFALVQSVQENASLRSKIVQSPDKLQRALEEKKLIRIEAKNAERAAMQSIQEKTAVHEVYTKACKKLSKNLAQMQAIQEQVNSAKSIEKDVKVLKVKESDEGMLDKSLEAKLVERQGKVEQLGEVRKQLEKERDLRYEEATKEFNIVKSEVEARRHDLKLRQTKVEAVVAEGDAIIAKINSVKESGAAQRQELKSGIIQFLAYSKQ